MRWPLSRRRPEGATALFSKASNSPETHFTFKLFHELARKDSAANLFFSPCSVMLCLAMVYDGAQGETRRGMAQALQLSGVDSESFENVVARLRTVLGRHDSDVQLLISNSMWCNQNIQVDPEYTARVRSVYDADICRIDFSSADAAAGINAWINKKTGGKISHMIGGLDPLAVLVALNAIYFKGLWQRPFVEEATRHESFTTGSGREKRLPRMLQFGRFQYFERRQFQAVKLPYRGSRFAMYVILPSTKSSLAELHQLLTAKSWEHWTQKFAERAGSLGLPRFKIDCSINLRAALENLGMERAFDHAHAEFGGIRNEPPLVWVDQVMHRAVGEVNEKGTEAAAATAVVCVSSMRPRRPTPSFTMIVDRPFLVLIQDELTGTILFIGSVADPDAIA
jgi:serine protease inhibitor